MRMASLPLWPRLTGLIARLCRDEGGNVLILLGLSLIPLTFAVGFAVDYVRAERMQTKLNAIADSAALVAVSPAYISKTDAVAAAAAQAKFTALASGLTGVTITSLTATAPTTSSGSLAGTRVSTVTYTATSTNVFAGILGKATLPIGGTAVADASQPPSINFYVMLDTSPSMLLPVTTSGTSYLANALISSTYSKGCDFACHTQHFENMGMTVTDSSSRVVWLDSSTASSGYSTYYLVNTSTKVVYNSSGTQLGTSASISSSAGTLTYKATTTSSSGKTTTSGSSTTISGMYADSWWLARNFGKLFSSPTSIELRIDAETTAAQNLITYAQTMVANYTSTAHPVVYKMQFYQFNYATPQTITSALTDVNSLSSSSITDLGLNAPLLYNNGYWTSSSKVTNDEDSDFTTMFTTINSAMPDPGDGSSTSSPQEVLLIVTDGMADMALSGSSCQTSGRACTQLLTSHLAQCTTIKNRGIRIAILYTEYLASTIQGFGISFANTVATTNVPYIETQLKSCASTNSDGSKLYYKVSADDDISTALNQLFATAVQNAYLAK
ncbi:TadE/TadG family type IV pilus assembly protein [Novosphingobium terrae]|uniref:TadE/TadG family type IV pilus assembly protein n=1 Tax=Novosphingobium terrae TaxID=2726189 RepID=UPI0019801672|nr:TadE/TadG family type IV pilus assembly protein [Novosphingobium terrae]